MDIQIHGDLDIAVSQDFTETFDIESHIDASGGKGMSEHMKMKILALALFKQTSTKSRLFSSDDISEIIEQLIREKQVVDK